MTWRSTPVTYGLSLAALALAVLVRWLMDPLLGDYFTTVTLYGAIAFAACIGGYRPALLVTILGWLAVVQFVFDPGATSADHRTRTLLGCIVYLVTSGIIIALGNGMRRAQQRSSRAEALAYRQVDALRTTLSSVGDGVITTDAEGKVTFFNKVAADLTGWSLAEASGRRLPEIFNIVNERTRRKVENPVEEVLRKGHVVGLANHTILIARNGVEHPIDDSAAPIRDGQGRITGVILVFRDITERRKAEQSVARLASIVESSDDAIISKDLGGIIQSWNHGAERILGYTAAEAVGQSIVFIIPPELLQEETMILQRLSRGEQIAHYETVRLAKDGRRIDVSITISPLRDAEGQIVGASKVARDISERKRSEEALRQSEERYRAFVESQSEMLCRWCRDGSIDFANRAYARCAATTPEELVRRSFWDFIDTQEHTEIQAKLNRMTPETPEAQTETSFEAEDGRRWTLWTHRALSFDGARRWVEIQSTGVDITDRKRAEEALRQGEKRLKGLVDNAADAIITIDQHGTIESINPAAERMFGYAPAEVVGRNVNILMPSPYRDEHDSYIANYLRTGEAKIIGIGREVAGRRKDGTVFPMELAVSEYGYGGHRLFTGIVRDITERKLAEERLKEADRRKDEFLATLAHELRNPLAPLRNGLGILKLRAEDPRAVEHVRVAMDRQLTHMVRLVDDLLDLSRITRDKLELRMERTELASAIYQALEACRPLAESLRHNLVVDLPPEPICVYGDPARLAQVFGNLLNNACKYTPSPGLIEVGVRIAPATQSDGDTRPRGNTKPRPGAHIEANEIVVSIRDNGIGIPPEMLPKVFDMFVQVDQSLERTHGGLGLGLTLVKRLVEMHGGSIQAFSAGPGNGSEFIVRLPHTTPTPAEPAPEQRPDATQAAGQRILIVDDNQDSAKTLAMLLKIMGYQTHTAHDGEEALEMAEQLRPDVVLLDIGLPKMNGYEVCRALRQQPWGRSIMTIAITGWGQEEDRRRSTEAGFDGHLVKPVDHDALANLLSSMKTSGHRQPTAKAN